MSDLEQKRGRGRPENNDNEVLTDILNDKNKRKEFVSAVSEKYGLSKGLLNKKVTAIVKDKEGEEADKALTLHELLTEV